MHISIVLTASGMLLIDSWRQETYISSISMPSFDIKETNDLRKQMILF